LKIPSGERHELCRGVHAEQNVIIQAAVHGVSTKNATIYCSTYPCSICAKLIINAEISRIVYVDDYEDARAKKLFANANMKVMMLKND
jgi:dCMP deaminase